MNLPAHIAAALLAVQTAAAEPPTSPADSVRSHRHARTLQLRFERLRLRHLPRTPHADGHACDEIIGRLCVWDDGDDDWEPKEEAAEIVAGRERLLAGLDSLATLVPGDHWVLGQRIRYLVESGRLQDAEVVAAACGLPSGWRCDAHLGHVLHHRTDFLRSEAAFGRALDAMPPDVRDEWTSPRPVLGRELRRWRSAQPDTSQALARLWTLADPLFLAEGNDRWTAHLSRWSYAMTAERAANPYDINWGRDFTEVTVRYGWPIAWERSWPRVGLTRSSVTGRDFTTAFRAFPPLDVLGRGPSGRERVIWEEGEDHPRSAYLPPYLDSLGELDAQVGRFWRPGHVVVMAAWRAPHESPADALAGRPNESARTSPAGRGGNARDDGAPGPGPPSPVLSGLFVEREGAVAADVRTIAEQGGTVRLRARVPWTQWGVVSLEAWAPDLRSAHRRRVGMGFPQLPAGLFALSDLVLLEAGMEVFEFGDLPGALRPNSELAAGETLNVALEVYGLGVRPETVQFSARVEGRDDGFLRRVGRRLRLLDAPEVVSIAWRESGPESPGPLLRTLQVGLSGLEPGEYALVVEVSAPGRSTLAASRAFTVR